MLDSPDLLNDDIVYTKQNQIWFLLAKYFSGILMIQQLIYMHDQIPLLFSHLEKGTKFYILIWILNVAGCTQI